MGPPYLQRIATYLLTNIQRIAAGRGMSAHFNGIRIITIYAPSGSEKKREKEEFYNGEVARLPTHSSDNAVLAGDFNCVLTPSDCTGSLNVSRALTRLVTGLDLVDVNQRRMIYTHYTAQGVSRTDRIYLSRQLSKSKQGVVANSCCIHGPPVRHVTCFTFCPLHDTG